MNILGDNIARYRKEKGLSQEKLAEYMGTSRQAVTKWESGISRPSTENLLKLSELFGVKVESLLKTDTDTKEQNATKKDATTKEVVDVSMGKAPGIWCILSAMCVIVYLLYGAFHQSLSVGTLICIIVIALPVQLFLNLYLTNAIRNEDYGNIAGFDADIHYNMIEVKKLLVNINQHISATSTLYIFLIAVGSYSDVMGIDIDIVGLLVVLYIVEIVGTILYLNYKAIEKIYCDERDKKIAKASLPVTVSYLTLLLVGTVIFISTFYLKGIENNTGPALALCAVLLVGVIFATLGFFIENKRLKQWDFSHEKYRVGRIYKVSLLLAVLCFAVMPFVVK